MIHTPAWRADLAVVLDILTKDGIRAVNTKYNAIVRIPSRSADDETTTF